MGKWDCTAVPIRLALASAAVVVDPSVAEEADLLAAVAGCCRYRRHHFHRYHHQTNPGCSDRATGID